MSERENFADIKLRGMPDRSMRSETEMARELIQLTDWSTAGNLSNRSSGVQIPRDICTRFGRYLYSTRCSWIINAVIIIFNEHTRAWPEIGALCFSTRLICIKC